MSFTFRHIERSYALEAHARDLCHRLEQFGERIMQYHMILEGPGEGAAERPPYLVKIELAVPGAQINVDSLEVDDDEDGDIYAAMRKAFDSAKRQLQVLHYSRVASVRSP